MEENRNKLDTASRAMALTMKIPEYHAVRRKLSVL
jgi:hypothetical protein